MTTAQPQCGDTDGHELDVAPAMPRRLPLRWDTDRIPVWDGAPFELGYAVDVVYQPGTSAALDW
ncbi:MAG: hypothetical protein AB7H93_04460 [Vicinamibacterales bacterium]